MTLYHATEMKNLCSIIEKGLVPSKYDGITYFTDNFNDCTKFAMIHGVAREDILVCKVDLPDSDVFETFDHNPNFFKCRCFGYDKVIPDSEIEYLQIDLNS